MDDQVAVDMIKMIGERDIKIEAQQMYISRLELEVQRLTAMLVSQQVNEVVTQEGS